MHSETKYTFGANKPRGGVKGNAERRVTRHIPLYRYHTLNTQLITYAILQRGALPPERDLPPAETL